MNILLKEYKLRVLISRACDIKIRTKIEIGHSLFFTYKAACNLLTLPSVVDLLQLGVEPRGMRLMKSILL